MIEAPKYSLVEIERRWLVDLSAVDLVRAPFREIDDLYIADSRLRLRRISGPNEVVFKLGKKYGKRTALSEPITNLCLTESEYRRFAGLPGHHARKRRYSLPPGTLDVYLEPNRDLAVFEVEFDDEEAANEFEPPSFVTREITMSQRLAAFHLRKVVPRQNNRLQRTVLGNSDGDHHVNRSERAARAAWLRSRSI